VIVSGEWPRPITLRSGWARAEARRWNEHLADAQLRLVRGSAQFLERCVETIGTLGVEGVASPPLLPDNQRVWQRAGFEPYLELDLFRRSLIGPVDPPGVTVKVLDPPPWPRLVEIDAASFVPLWQMDVDGLQEAYRATNRATVLATGDDASITGFAIVGVAGTAGYLQRIAVDPAQRGAGLGKALVRSAIGWALKRGAHSMLLNTQPENTVSATLYVAEGFVKVDPGLSVLRKPTS
jgi:GNAT superfamily N-acetyltransferase